MIDDDDGTDEEIYVYAPGEAESWGTVTLPNGMVVGPGEFVDGDGTRHPAPKPRESVERSGWTAYAWRKRPPE